MLLHWAERRIRAASLAARPGRRTPRALALYAVLRRLANNRTGIALPKPGTLERELGVSRWTIGRAVDILEAAGVVVTELVHDHRGYRCGVRYHLVLEDPDGAAYVAYTQQHVRTSQRSKKSRYCSSAPSAPPLPPPAAGDKPKRAAPRPARVQVLEPATVGYVRLAIYAVREDPAWPDNDPDRADVVRQVLRSRGATCTEEAIRQQITAVEYRIQQRRRRYHPGADWRHAPPPRDRGGRRMPGPPLYIARRPDSPAERLKRFLDLPKDERDARRAAFEAGRNFE